MQPVHGAAAWPLAPLVHTAGTKTCSTPRNARSLSSRRTEESLMLDSLSQDDEFGGYLTERVLILIALFAAARR